MTRAKTIALLAAATATTFAMAPGLSASKTPAATSNSIAMRALEAHNAERDRVGVPRLKWNPSLARQAEDWGHSLARRGVLEHSTQAMRDGTGENLWMGTSGYWQVESMVGDFIAEKRHFRRASFPSVSATGNWADVGHYTQLVWRDTQEVGCAVVTSRGNDVLVCRYWPAGNVYGQKPF